MRGREFSSRAPAPPQRSARFAKGATAHSRRGRVFKIRALQSLQERDPQGTFPGRSPDVQAVKSDMLQIIGSIVVVGCVLGGFVAEGGHILALWHPFEVLIIVGSAFGAFLISNPMKVVKTSFTGRPRAPQGRALQARGLRHAAQADVRHPGEDAQRGRDGHRGRPREAGEQRRSSRNIRAFSRITTWSNSSPTACA